MELKRRNLVFCAVVCAAILCIAAFLLADIHHGGNAEDGQSLSATVQA